MRFLSCFTFPKKLFKRFELKRSETRVVPNDCEKAMKRLVCDLGEVNDAGCIRILESGCDKLGIRARY